MTTSPPPLRIAIVGGGVAGLSAAYYLQKRAREQKRPVEITLFEETRTLGGNADTVHVDLGQRLSWPEMIAPERYVRWADLGVNDANLAAYKRMKALMYDIDYPIDHWMPPLQDTASFCTGTDWMRPPQDTASSCTGTDKRDRQRRRDDSDGDRVVELTDDRALVRGVITPRTGIAEADGGRLLPLIEVVHATAMAELESPALKSIDEESTYTCGAFFGECAASPKQMLAAAADRLGVKIDWGDPDLRRLVEKVRDDYYYPRISAMYFTDPDGPAGMPLRAPFEYYRLQESGDPPDRRYFRAGAQHWINWLGRYLVKPREHGCAPVQICVGQEAKVEVRPNDVRVTTSASGEDTAEQTFDLAIMAVHADHAKEALRFDGRLKLLGDELKSQLELVRYTESYAICHTDSRRLPENRNCWRTYNIRIRRPDEKPLSYRIDYVVNLHQNDPFTSQYNQAGLPAYFVSLADRPDAIPEHEVLDRCDPPASRDWDVGAFTALGADATAGGESDAGYRRRKRRGVSAPPVAELPENKAWNLFRHNVLDAQCLRVQHWFDHDYHRFVNAVAPDPAGDAVGAYRLPLYFTGGWTRGAGLHEQCLEQSERISALVLTKHNAGAGGSESH